MAENRNNTVGDDFEVIIRSKVRSRNGMVSRMQASVMATLEAGIGLCYLCHLALESLYLVDQLQETDLDQFCMYIVEKLLTYQSMYIAIPRSRWDN